MPETLVYTLPDCHACETARSMLDADGERYRTIPIDNPLTEIGVRSLFRDRRLAAPVVLRPGRGAFILSGEAPPRFVRIVTPHDNQEPSDGR